MNCKETFDIILSEYLIVDNKEISIMEAIEKFESEVNPLPIGIKDTIIKYFYTLKFIKTIASEKFDKWYNYKSKINYNNFRNLNSYHEQIDFLINTFEI